METTSTGVEIERLERKVDMSLDEIIKMQKKIKRKARKGSGNSSFNTGHITPQGSVALCLSAIQKEKLVQRRSQGISNIAFAKQAGFKAVNGNDMSKIQRRNRRQMRKTIRLVGGATKNITVLVSYDLRRRKSGAAPRLSQARDKLKNSDLDRNLQTLDSRFASLRRVGQVQFAEQHGF